VKDGVLHFVFESASNGSVFIKLKCSDSNIEITITDNGCGIPKEILPKVTDHGFSFGKNSGAGFGLSYAKQQIEKLNGQLIIHSEEKSGTKVVINLLRSAPPSWFCESLTFHLNSTIVVLDDDPSIHDAWNERLNSISGVDIIHFSRPSELLNNNDSLTINYYLIDYELLNENENGLNVIDELHVNKQSFLVTSCFDDMIVRSRCEKIGVKIIPKSYVPYIPIKLVNKVSKNNNLVFIDDDEAMRMVWNFAAEEAGKTISTYASIEEFIDAIDMHDKETVIYIDSQLGNNIKGEIFAKELHLKGFTEIYLSTGYSSNKFEYMPWIKSIVGKQPPF